MKKTKMVIALGGNAIQAGDASAEAQQRALEKTAEQLVTFIENNVDVIITHGNGPQVGNILLQQKEADSLKNPAMPLDTCGAMSQGMIGYWMQNAMDKKLKQKGIEKDVGTIVTQVIVDKNDKAFEEPTKPIGPFYSEEEVKQLMANSNAVFKEDAGRGYRRVVPSPTPVKIQEYKMINKMVDSGAIVIAVGGGGIPVIQDGDELKGIEAVIDKDFASQKLAELVDADMLVILTTVDNVYTDYNKPTQQKLTHVSVKELQTHMEEGHFAPGSMLPKVEAAIKFATSKAGRVTIITSLEKAYEAVNGQAGTIITS